MAKGKKPTTASSEHPVLCPDGKYRWVYDIPMLTNPSIFFDVLWVLAISFGIVWLFVVLLGIGEGLDTVWSITKGFLVLLAVFFVIGIVAYILVAWHYGWKYSVLFIMDEKEVVHQQLPSTVDKARAIGYLTATATGKAGMGMLIASRTSMTTSLDSVRRLIPCRRKNLIKVNERLSRNRVFVSAEDFDFVYQFLCQHCPKAQKK